MTELLNSYLAIEGLLSSRLLTEDTKQKAYEALKILNQQFAEAMGEYVEEHGHDHRKADAEAA